MHPLIAKLPFVRRPFYQLDVARQERAGAMLERDRAIQECDALKRQLTEIAAATGQPVAGGAPRDNVDGAARAAVRTPPRFCVFCQSDVDGWLPFRITTAKMSEFLKRVRTVGSNVERFSCPHCGSIDRERHLRLFLDRLGILASIKGGAVLHVAPEPHLQHCFREADLSLYVKSDLLPVDDSIRRIDVQRIPFPDQTFDLVICNHVLEHVQDPVVALGEIQRVLKYGGRLVCQTPFATRLTDTLQDPLLQSIEDRLFFYGQEDHLRLFGAHIEELFRNAGFVGRLVPHAEVLPDVDPERLGVNEDEPFFDFVRAAAAAT